MNSRRSGFALPMAILLIGFMTAGLVAAFTRVEAESRTVDHLASETQALALAQAGLDRVIAAGDTAPGFQSITLPGGAADVTITRLRRAVTSKDTSMWLIRSAGRTTARAGGRPSARRTVAQIAIRAPGQMQVLSSWTSLSGLQKAGGSGDIIGNDMCGQEAAVAGVAVPTSSYIQTGSGDVITGSPPISYMGTQDQMKSQINIDWNGITNAGSPAVQPDIVVCKPGTYGYDPNWGPCGEFPTTFPTNYWPVILINGSSTLPHNGQGTVMVTGDLTLGGNDQWQGILLVGGRIVDNGSGDIQGAVVTGLNVKRPDPWPSTVQESSKANGTKDYQYDSCDVAKAAGGFRKMMQLTNAWMDSYSTW